MKFQITRLILVVLIGVMFSSCRSKDGDLNVFSIENDIQIGETYFKNIEKMGEGEVLDPKENKAAYAYINEIKKQIVSSPEILHQEEFIWDLRIIKDDSTINAFCSPGGYICVYTGLIKFLNSKDQLAGVLSHEIAHADLRHSTEQLTKSLGLKLILSIIFGTDGGLISDATEGLAGLSFGRDDETEADLKGVEYLKDTPYDPAGSVYFFDKMSKKGESMGRLEFLSTHPNPENRVQDILDKCKELEIEKRNQDTASYKEFLKLF